MKKEVKALFEAFCEAYNLHTSAITKRENPEQKEFYSNDFIKISYNHGGYLLVIIDTTTCQLVFDDHSRMPESEFCSYLKGLLAGKDSVKFNGILKQN